MEITTIIPQHTLILNKLYEKPIYSPSQVIYVARNPKDVVVSSFFFHQMASCLGDPGLFEEFLDKFLAGKGEICYLPKIR